MFLKSRFHHNQKYDLWQIKLKPLIIKIIFFLMYSRRVKTRYLILFWSKIKRCNTNAAAFITIHNANALMWLVNSVNVLPSIKEKARVLYLFEGSGASQNDGLGSYVQRFVSPLRQRQWLLISLPHPLILMGHGNRQQRPRTSQTRDWPMHFFFQMRKKALD